MRRLTNSASAEASAASNPERLPCLMHWHRGLKRDSRRGYGANKVLLGRVWVVKRWHGIRYVRSSLPSFVRRCGAEMQLDGAYSRFLLASG